MFLFSKALALRGHRHSGIMNMNQTPSAVLLLIELSFPAVSCERRTIFSELGSEIPIKLGLGRVAVQVHGNVMNAWIALREGIAHQMLIRSEEHTSDLQS